MFREIWDRGVEGAQCKVEERPISSIFCNQFTRRARHKQKGNVTGNKSEDGAAWSLSFSLQTVVFCYCWHFCACEEAKHFISQFSSHIRDSKTKIQTASAFLFKYTSVVFPSNLPVFTSFVTLTVKNIFCSAFSILIIEILKNCHTCLHQNYLLPHFIFQQQRYLFTMVLNRSLKGYTAQYTQYLFLFVPLFSHCQAGLTDEDILGLA